MVLVEKRLLARRHLDCKDDKIIEAIMLMAIEALMSNLTHARVHGKDDANAKEARLELARALRLSQCTGTGALLCLYFMYLGNH